MARLLFQLALWTLNCVVWFVIGMYYQQNHATSPSFVTCTIAPGANRPILVIPPAPRRGDGA